MKNKGMHQQPNAFTPSTGGSSAGKGTPKEAFQPDARRPQSGTPSQNWTDRAGLNKSGKKVA